MEDLWKGYTVGVRGCSVRVAVLRGVSFRVERGERLGVLGAPGAGKTTLLHCLAGLRQPDRGRVEVAAPGAVALELIDEGLLERSLPRRSSPAATVIFSRELARLRARTDRVIVLRDGRVTPHGPRHGARSATPPADRGDGRDGARGFGRQDPRVVVPRRVAEPAGDAGAPAIELR